VATILGLLLIVTFIANYLTTQLPNTMGQNDLQHEVTVQNQVALIGALIQKTAEKGGAGAEISLPISLGSAAAPPFAGQDSSEITSLANQSTLRINFTLSGPFAYAPPTGAPLGGIVITGSGGICPTPTAFSFSFTGTCTATWNFTGPAGSVFSFSETGGTGSQDVNVTTNSSTITVAGTGSAGAYYQFIGNHNTISMTGVGSGPTVVSVVGSYNTLSISTTGSSVILVNEYGNHDSVTFPTTTGSQYVKIVAYGTLDTFSGTGTGSDTFGVYFNGFNATAPTSSRCPYANLSSTDGATSFSETGSGGLTEYFNNVVGYWANHTLLSGAGSCPGNATGCWTSHSRNVPTSTCPFFSAITLPVGSPTVAGSGFVVHLHNTYAPLAEVALDEGAVVFAQSSSVPVFILPPRIYYSDGVLEILLPQFSGAGARVSSQSGVGTADASLRLLYRTPLVLPGAGYAFQNGTSLTITIASVYAAAWYAYFQASSTLAPFVTCTGAASVCTALYYPNGPVGTVKIVLPTSGLRLEMLTAVYAFTLA